MLGPFQAVDGGDGGRLVGPNARVDRGEVAAEYLECEAGLLLCHAEFVLQFLLPLRGKAGGGDDQRAFGLAALVQGLPDHARFDGLA